MINEANEPSSACRLWRVSQVETSTPPSVGLEKVDQNGAGVKFLRRRGAQKGFIRGTGWGKLAR